MKKLEPQYVAARKALIELAKNGSSTRKYQTFSDEAFLGFDVVNDPQDRKEMGDFLGVISEYEHENHRPLLSVLIQHDGLPGNGFFEMAERLGRYIPNFMDKSQFVKQEMRYLKQYWGNHNWQEE